MACTDANKTTGVIVIRTIAMPSDTNPAGDIFGGWLMAQMDLAAGNLAGSVSQGRSATVAVEGMQFLRPVKVGDEVTLYATLRKVGRTSMRIHVDVWARPPLRHRRRKGHGCGLCVRGFERSRRSARND